MTFFSRLGYLVVVFFIAAAFISGGLGTAYHLSRESTTVLLFLFWGVPCVIFGRKYDKPKKHSALFGLPMEYWGYGLIVLGVLDIYVSWNSIARDWFTSVAYS
ncbi:MAG TPA: hypothetical protein VLZ74_10645 [Methylocella sp.]|nr:hypothetical protein [Methylocella sp.]